ncbi:Myb-like DNA-binding domain protein [Physocladia obscura]|uniref:Myb-like DNA-binding domain protein n=1 Tax=Physocladia obscura TaxID=109957 RepID=A0AAD5T2Y0_9FUNG|nr:Myb-like DNA-binding domain protein [Physocladia obscura]
MAHTTGDATGDIMNNAMDDNSPDSMLDEILMGGAKTAGANMNTSASLHNAISANLRLQEAVRARLRAASSAVTRLDFLSSTQSAAQTQPMFPRAPPYFVDNELNPSADLAYYFLQASPENNDAKFLFHVNHIYKPQLWSKSSIRALRQEIERENMRSGIPLPLPNDARLHYNTTDLNWSTIARNIPPGDKSATDCRIQWLVNLHPNINRALFTQEEVARLGELVKLQQEQATETDWDTIAIELGNGRVAWQCFRIYQKYMNPALQLWTHDEDTQLKKLVEIHGNGNWATIAKHMNNRTRLQCQTRWRQNLRPGLRRGRFTKDEDNLLKEAVARFGIGSWAKIANAVQTRNDVQCRERYLDVLNPEIVTGPFSKEDDELLLKLIAKFGQKWSAIAAEFRTRTAKMCKRQYARILKVQE